MPTLKYALEPGGDKRLVIDWKPFWKDVSVTLDGKPVGVVPDQKALSAGREFSLPDASVLKVQLVRNFFGARFQVLWNGIPLPGSASDPAAMVKTAAGIVYFIAGLNLVLGLLVLLFNIDFLAQIGIGWFNIVWGFIFLVLAYFVGRRSVVALIIAIVLFALDGLAGFFLAILNGNNPGAGGLIFRVVLLVPMFQGIAAIRTTQKGPKPAGPQPIGQ
jgi:hypothetical protein